MSNFQLTGSEYDQEALRLLDILFPHMEGDFILSHLIEEDIIGNKEDTVLCNRLQTKLKTLMFDRYEYAEQAKGYRWRLTSLGKEVKRKGGHFAVNPIPITKIENKQQIDFKNTITPINKDKIMLYLIDNFKPNEYYEIYQTDFLDGVELDKNTVETILFQFEKIGLISFENNRIPLNYVFSLNAAIYDFIREGGFGVREELLVHQLSKILEDFEKSDKVTPKGIAESVDKMVGGLSKILALGKTLLELNK